MTTSTTAQRPLRDLLAELEAAVRAGDRARAAAVERAILQRLATDAAERAATERRVRALMEELEQPAAAHHRRPPAPPLPPAPTPQGGLLALDELEIALEAGAERGIELRAERGAARGAPPPSEGVVYPVWFGTNRRPAPDGGGFTGERHDRITRGRVDVHVPEAHRFGETGTAFWKRMLRFDLRDDRLRIQRVERQERDPFFAGIHEAMQAARDGGERPHALFFLHGFNVSFTEAAIRAAQIGYDLKVPGATAFFSWPSRGTVSAYPADEASIEASERAITEFLLDFTASCGAEVVHVIAHSMGNRGLLRALQRIAADARTRGTVRFGQIVLAAPDVDRDLFVDLAALYGEHAERTTLYASDADLPVHLSARLHDAPRAGYYAPYTVAPHVDTVAVPDFDVDLLGHSYFAQAEALLHDIHDLLRHGEAPGRRQRIVSAASGGTTFWRLAR